MNHILKNRSLIKKKKARFIKIMFDELYISNYINYLEITFNKGETNCNNFLIMFA